MLIPGHRASPEPDHLPAAVSDRKHNAAAETVVAASVFVHDHETAPVCFLHFRVFVVFSENALKALPGVRRIPQRKPCRRFSGNAAGLEVILRPRVFLKRFNVKVRRLLHAVSERPGPRFALCSALFLRHHHADAVGKLSDRFRVGEPLVAHHKADGASCGAAAETLKKLLLGIHGKRRRLFLVKRAAGHVVFSGLFKRHNLVDHLHDVNAV